MSRREEGWWDIYVVWVSALRPKVHGGHVRGVGVQAAMARCPIGGPPFPEAEAACWRLLYKLIFLLYS